MHILEFPQELLDKIIYYGILSRGLPRALRLSLVCKSFYIALQAVLFSTKLFDDDKFLDHFRKWDHRKYHGVETLWHDYLVFRCRKERDESIHRYVEIRNVATALLPHCQERGDCNLDSDAILDGLCWLLQERGDVWPWDDRGWHKRGAQRPNLNRSLLSGAAYFGFLRLAKSLLDEGYDPTTDDNLFPSAMYIAAWTGQADMLQLLQEYLPDFDNPMPHNDYWGWRSKIGPRSLPGAVIRGDIDIVRLTLYPPSRTIAPVNRGDTEVTENIERESLSNAILVLGERPGYVTMQSKLGFYIRSAMRRTQSPEIYRYLQGFFSEGSIGPIDLASDLEAKAKAGDILMVQHILGIRADLVNSTAKRTTALWHAVRTCHEDVVDLLLESGANPTLHTHARTGTCLTAAAQAGSMAMLQKLLGAGAVIDPDTDRRTLTRAVELEHTAMVEALLDLEAGLGSNRARLSDWARKEGLESMVELLASRGIGVP